MAYKQSITKKPVCGFFRIDLNSGIIVDCDDKFLSMIGYNNQKPKDNLIQLENLMYNEASSFYDNLKTAMQNNELFFYYSKIFDKYKNDFDVLLYAGVHNDYSYILIHNISEYKKDLNNPYLNNEENGLIFKTLMKNIGCAVFSYNESDGNFGFISDSFLDLFGYNKEEFKLEFKNNFFNIIYHEDKKRVVALIEEQSKNSDNVEISFRIVNIINSLIYVIYRGIRVNIHNKYYYYGTLVDITEVKVMQDKLTEMNLQMNALISNVPGGVASFLIDKGELKIQYANDEFYRLLGYSKFEYDVMTSDYKNKIIYEKDFEKIKNDIKNSLYKNLPIEFELRIYNKNRGLIWLSIKAKFFKYIEGKPMYYGVFMDINDRKEMEHQLAIQAERYNLIEEITEEIQFEYDAQTDTILLPKKFTGKRVKDSNKINKFLNRDILSRIIHNDDLPSIKKTIQRVLKRSDKGIVEFRAIVMDKTYKWHRMHYINVINDDGCVIRVVGRIKNIDEEKTKQVKLEQRVKADPLTNLLNKIEVKFSIDNFLITEADKSMHAILLIDIDNFKNVNDSLGHIMGDTAILDIAASMKSVFRISDYLGRVGGDEFVIFMKNINKDVVKEKAAELCSRINRVYKNNKIEVKISCSIGIAFYPNDGNGYDDLFSKADLAMYYSKIKGGNYYISYEEIIENI